MAPKVTSSSTRSSRKSAKPVTTAKGRVNRSAASNATVSSGRGGSSPKPTNRVTSASYRTSTGSARVTGTPRPALPPAGGTGGSRRPAAAAARPNSRTQADGQPLPNGRRVGANGPQQGAEFFRNSTQGPTLRGTPPRTAGSKPPTPTPAAKPSGNTGPKPKVTEYGPRLLAKGAVNPPKVTEYGPRLLAKGAKNPPSRPSSGGRLSGLKAAGKALIGNKLNIATIGLGAVEGALAASNTKWGQGVRDARARNEQATKDAIDFGMSKLPGGGKGDQPNSRGKTNIDPYGTSKPKASNNQERTGTQLAAEMGAKPTPTSKPPTPRPSTPRPTAFTPSAPPTRRSGGGGGDIIRERPSAAVSRPSARSSAPGRSSAPARPTAAPSAPKAPPAAAAPTPKAPATPAEPNLFNAPRTGVAKFRTDMNPLGKKIVGTTNFSKSVPSERAFDATSDYSSSLSIPDKKKRKS